MASCVSSHQTRQLAVAVAPVASFDSTADHVAMLDRDGVILAVNAAWQRFARDNGVCNGACVDVGVSYLHVCRKAAEDGDPDSRAALEGIQAVLADQRESFALEYPCHSADERRWFRMTVTPNDRPASGALVVHSNITPHKQIELVLQDRLRFEQFLAELSTDFIDLPAGKIEPILSRWLQRVIDFFRFDRGVIGEVLDGDRLKLGYCCTGPGVAPLASSSVDPPLPWYAAQIRRGECIGFSSLDELPADAAAEKRDRLGIGVTSGLTFPLEVGGARLGFIAFGMVSSDRLWSPELRRRLRLVKEVFANALLRRHREAELRQALAQIQALTDRLQAENVYLREEIQHAQEVSGIVGTSAPIRRALDQAAQVARTDATVLLLGETGTGKGLIARAIHNGGRRKDAPFITVNCAALPSSLIESELFGHEKGAFTGALSRQIGRFELADGGTLFLDEIGELAPEMQAKLLRALQDGEFERLGSAQTVHVDVRVVAATNRDLFSAMQKAEFRSDLYYRLSVFPIRMPSLREHREDIPLLVWHFIAQKQRRLGKRVEQISPELMQVLAGYDWPGNVRELENVVERALILSPGCTLVLDESCPIRHASAGSPTHSLHDADRAHIRSVLDACNWRVKGPNNAAERLGLKPSTLYFRMKKLGIVRPS